MEIKTPIIHLLVILGVLVFYFLYTIWFYKKLKHSVLFSRRIKRFHTVAIWVIPFIWILILKAFTMRTPGSHEMEHTPQDEPWSDPYAGP
jgi:heme/copper-type cytochrome/quinol oxidase subunit 2